MSNSEQDKNTAPNSSDKPMSQSAMGEFQKIIQAYAEAAWAGRTEEAENIGFQALMFAAEEAQKDPTPDLRAMQEAVDCESNSDWSGAERARLKVLSLEEASGNSATISKAHLDLSKLFDLLGRSDDAWNSALAATSAARRSEVEVILAMALQNEAACALKKGDAPTALAAASEAVRIIEPGPLHGVSRVQTWLTRARCLLANGDLSSAENDLAQGRELLQAKSYGPMAAGWISTLARWWEVHGAIQNQKSHLSAAVESYGHAVEERRRVAELPHAAGPYAQSALAQALEKCGEASRRAGDLGAAEQALQEAKTIRVKIGLAN